MKNQLLAVVATLLVASVSAASFKKLDSCDQDTSYKFASTRTSYNLVGNSTSFDDYIKFGAKQIGLWHLSRHGGRYPDTEDIDLMNEITAELKEKILDDNEFLCKDDLTRMEEWQSRIFKEDDHLLTTNGRFYMRALGTRMHNRLFEIVSAVSGPSQVAVQCSNEVRTQHSADEYLAGLLNFLPKSELPVYNINPPTEDYLLKASDICKKYVDFYSQKKGVYCPEQKQFDDDSKLYWAYRKIFASRVGVSDKKGDKLEDRFDFALKMCQYEYIIDGTDSVWCKFFDRHWLQLVEYREDIKNNCRYGKRHAMNTLKECDLVKNAADNLRGFVRGYETSDASAKKIQLLFSHSSTVAPFYTILGLGVSADDFNLNDIYTENVNRKFRGSFLDPLNSNIAFVLYRSDDVNGGNEYTIRVFLNENLVKIKPCKSTDCKLEELVDFLDEFVESCGSSKQYCQAYK